MTLDEIFVIVERVMLRYQLPRLVAHEREDEMNWTTPEGIIIKPLPGHSGYGITADGRVWTCIKPGPGSGTRGWRSLHPFVNWCGYQTVKLRGKHQFVHRLVATAFLGEGPENHQVNHIDGVKTNNHWANLEWVTPSANMRHACTTGLKCSGEKHPNHVLTEAEVAEIRGRLAVGESARKLAPIFGVSNTTIKNIRKGKAWAGR